MTQRALILIDLQEDFLKAGGLEPNRQALVEQTNELLIRARRRGLPVFHVHTIVGPMGEGGMPHWIRNGDRRCRKGSQGASSPPLITARQDEGTYHKTHYSAFDSPELDSDIRARGCDTVAIAGVHTHACIHATVLDAYRLGYSVEIVSDCVASYDPAAAAVTLRQLARRACQVRSTAALLPEESEPKAPEYTSAVQPPTPCAYFGGQWHTDAEARRIDLQDPCRNHRTRAAVTLAGPHMASRALEDLAASTPHWRATPMSERITLLARWKTVLEENRESLVASLIQEIGKPRATAEQEFEYGIRLIETTIKEANHGSSETIADGVEVHYRPRGMVLVITPWNNPLAIPIGKLAPALVFGNSVLWKPAPHAPHLVETLLATLAQAGFPSGSIAMLHGDSDTVNAILEQSRPQLVTFTGSEAAGRQLAMSCAAHGRPLQAELGGNNAAVVGNVHDIERTARLVAQAAFSFSGQRCTAPRRLIVVDPHYAAFCEALRDACQELRIGDPHHPDTQIGPLRCEDRVRSMHQQVNAATEAGGQILTGGAQPRGFEDGAWFEPTVVTGLPSDSPLVQEEAFGPVVVLQRVASFAEAVDRVNSVRQGLRAILFSDDPCELAQFPQTVETGIIHLNPAAGEIHPEAPFFGWKQSGIGLPEHGRWDRDQYTFPTAVYTAPQGTPSA